MTDPADDLQACHAEIARLTKVAQALIERAERSTSAHGTGFSLFQTTVMLEEQVRRRTEALEAALRENERITRALRESEGRFRGVVNQSLVGIAIIENGRFSFSNPKLGEIFGYSADELLGMGPVDIVVPEDRAQATEQIRRRMAGEVDHVEYTTRGLRKNGSIIDVEIHGSAMEIHGRRALLSVVQDITERVRADREVRALKDQLLVQATHDRLTGLYNRTFLDEALPRELALAQRQGYSIGAVIGDIDHFKSINDRFGHQAGDEVLRAVSALLRRHARRTDIFCRYGGEEFLLVMPGMSTDTSYARAEILRTSIAATTISFGGADIRVTASFGVAAFPAEAQTDNELIAAADKALYAAKKGGRNKVLTYTQHLGVLRTGADSEIGQRS